MTEFGTLARRAWSIVQTGAAVALCVLAGGAQSASAQSMERVSVTAGGGQLTTASFDPAISADGRFVAFESTTLFFGSQSRTDIVVRDRTIGTTRLVSVTDSEGIANGDSLNPAISADGRFVAFDSLASNLVAGDTNSDADIFIRDLTNGTTRRVSVSDSEEESNDTSAGPAISADGRFVAFESDATNLVEGDTNAQRDIFVRDLTNGTTRRVSVPRGGGQPNSQSANPAISADGTLVGFSSHASNLVDNDTNSASDIFRRFLTTGNTGRVSITATEGQANGASAGPAISADGRIVAFSSRASNLIGSNDTNGDFDVYVRVTGTTAESLTTQRVSISDEEGEANEGSQGPDISADGRFVVFASLASNLLRNDTNGHRDIFIRDRSTGLTRFVSSGLTTRALANRFSFDPAISADGRFVAFVSSATNLVDGDTNGVQDVFVRDRGDSAGFFGSWKRVRLRCRPRSRPRRCILTGRLRIANPGLRRARRSRVYFYLSKNRKLDRRDRRIRRRSVARLRAGGVRTIRFRHVLRRNVSRRFARRLGRRFLIAKLDATNRVREPNERDNVVVSKRLRQKRRGR